MYTLTPSMRPSAATPTVLTRKPTHVLSNSNNRTGADTRHLAAEPMFTPVVPWSTFGYVLIGQPALTHSWEGPKLEKHPGCTQPKIRDAGQCFPSQETGAPKIHCLWPAQPESLHNTGLRKLEPRSGLLGPSRGPEACRGVRGQGRCA